MTIYAIIGAGFSGTALVANLIQASQIYRFQNPLKIFLIEKNAFAEGAAYSTRSNVHLLNIGAGFMSLFPADKDHFLHWVQKRIPNCTPTTFVPRALYKKYLKSILREAERKQTAQCFFEKIMGEVISLAEESGKYLLRLKDGQELTVDKVILAMGNYPPSQPSFIGKSFLGSNRYLSNPWGKNTTISPFDTVFILGSGLTMIDKVLQLESLQHKGEIHVISRHGFIPKVANVDLDCSFALLNDAFAEAPQKVRSLLRILKEEIKKALSFDREADCVVHSFIYDLLRKWFFLRVEEQQRFLRHLKTHFSVFASRMPKESATIIQKLLDVKQLQIHAGRVCDFQEEEGKVVATFLPRHLDSPKTVKADIVMNCLGPTGRLQDIGDTFLNDLVSKGFVRANSFHLALDISRDLAVINAEGEESTNMFALGAIKKSPLGILTVPYIALEAQLLSQLLLIEHVEEPLKFQFANSLLLLKHKLGWISVSEPLPK